MPTKAFLIATLGAAVGGWWSAKMAYQFDRVREADKLLATINEKNDVAAYGSAITACQLGDHETRRAATILLKERRVRCDAACPQAEDRSTCWALCARYFGCPIGARADIAREPCGASKNLCAALSGFTSAADPPKKKPKRKSMH